MTLDRMTYGAEGSRLAEDLDFKEADFEEMVSRLAHEVRNPLATIKSSAQLVKRLRMPPDTARPYLESVVDEVTRIDRIIKELERYASLQARASRPVGVAEAVHSAVDSLRESLEETGVTVAVDAPDDLRVTGDSRLLRQAVGELVANAAQASPQGAEVRVRCRATTDARVEIHVEDSGPGIPVAIQDRFQRPFFSTSIQGVGLGLSVVLRSCRLLHGQLEWTNLDGCGCRFTIILPEA